MEKTAGRTDFVQVHSLPLLSYSSHSGSNFESRTLLPRTTGKNPRTRTEGSQQLHFADLNIFADYNINKEVFTTWMKDDEQSHFQDRTGRKKSFQEQPFQGSANPDFE